MRSFYVQPLFITAENVGIPELKKVVLVLGEEVVMADTFEDALRDLLGAGTDGTDPDPDPSPSPSPVPSGSPTPSPAPSPTEDDLAPDGDLDEIIAQAGCLYEKAQGGPGRRGLHQVREGSSVLVSY